MSQSDTEKALAAEERSQATKSLVRRVRSVTRHKYTPEEKIRIGGLPPRGHRQRPLPTGGYQASLLLLLDEGLRDAIAANGSPLSLTMMLQVEVARGRQSRGNET